MVNEQWKNQQRDVVQAQLQSNYTAHIQASTSTNKVAGVQAAAGMLQDANGVWKERWQLNYEAGTKYELYRVVLKQDKFDGLKYKDVCMILYQKKGIVLIALEIKIANQIKVFVNPTEYVFDTDDHYGYVIHHKAPDFDEINRIDLNKQSAENFCIMEYINKQE